MFPSFSIMCAFVKCKMKIVRKKKMYICECAKKKKTSKKEEDFSLRKWMELK